MDAVKKKNNIERYTGSDPQWRARINNLENFTGYSEVLLRYRCTSDDWDDGSSGFYLDDVSVDAFIPGETIVYGPVALPTSGALDPQNTEDLQWQYDFDTGGTYRLSVETQYGADGNAGNNLLDVIFDIDGSTYLPDFAGVEIVHNPGTGSSLEIYWSEANDPNLPITYSVFRFDHSPSEAEVNSTSEVWSGTTLEYHDTGLTKGQIYYYVVRAEDSLGQAEYNMVIMSGIPNMTWYLQIESSVISGYQELNIEPMNFGDSEATDPIPTPGLYQVGTTSWISDTMDNPVVSDDFWTFNIHGYSTSDQLEGYLFAKVYDYNLGTPNLAFTTAIDDEDVGLFTGSHEFTWDYVPPAHIFPAGERIIVEIWLDAIATSSGSSGQTTNPDFTANADDWTFNAWEDPDGTPTGTWTGTQGNPAGAVQIQLIDSSAGGPGVEETVSGYWEQAFITDSIPTTPTLEFDWSCWDIGTGDLQLRAQVFIDTSSGAPTNEVWNSGLITAITGWASVGPIDISSTLNAAATYYLKIAFRDTDLAKNEVTRTMGYDNVQINWIGGPPLFIMEYDSLTTPSNVEAGLSETLGGSWYEIPIPASAGNGDWVFVSFPYPMSGNIETILDDSVGGGGGTTWDVAKWYNPLDAADPWKTYRVGASTNEFTTINNQMGVWLQLTSSDGVLSTGLTGDYSSIAVDINLYTGWNLVSYPSATSRLASTTLPAVIADAVAYYDDAAPYLITDAVPGAVTFIEGNAYWVHVTADTLWSVAP